jgi:hypothetical protein
MQAIRLQIKTPQRAIIDCNKEGKKLFVIFVVHKHKLPVQIDCFIIISRRYSFTSAPDAAEALSK